MANIGLARLVIAKYLSSGRYEDGMRIHKAIKVELDPVYEDTSDYKDMTDLEEESTFMYSDIKLSIGCAPEEVELEVLGREIDNNQVVSSDKDNSARMWQYGYARRSSTRKARHTIRLRSP